MLGSTGCGKTSAILKLLEADICAGRSVVVLDLRGDLVQRVLSVCVKLQIDPGRVSLLDLREKERVLGFDPMSGPGEPFIRALHVLEVLKGEAGSWGVQLEETLRNALLLLGSAKQSLSSLARVFGDGQFRDECLRHCTDPELVDYWQRFDRFSDDKKRNIASPVLNKAASLLGVPVIRRVLSAPGLDLSAVTNRKGSVLLVSVAVDEYQGSGKMLGSLLVSALSREMMSRVNMPEGKRNPVRLYVDEFENMATVAFENLIAEGRRFGLSLVLSHQSLAQLPPRLRSVVRNNVETQVFFQCGFEDAQAVARELPEDTSADDVRGLKPGEAFVLFRNADTEHVRFNFPSMEASKDDVSKFREMVLPKIVDSKGKSARNKGKDLHSETRDSRSEKNKKPSRKLDLEDWL